MTNKDDFKNECLDIFKEQFGPDEKEQEVTEGVGAFVASSLQVGGWTIAFVSIFVPGLLGIELCISGFVVFLYGYIIRAFTKTSAEEFAHKMLSNKAFKTYIVKEGRKEFANMKKLYKQATTKLPSHIIAALDTNNTEKWAEWIDLSTDSVSLYDTMANYDVDIHLVTEDLHFDFLGDSSHIDRVVLVAYDAASDRVLYKNIRTPNKGEIEGFFKD